MIRGVVLAALVALGCGGDRIVVGAKNFTEQRLVGELVAQAIEQAGLRVERRFDLSGSFVCDAALRAGQLDVYVEYTGTALTAILKLPPASDAAAVLEAVRRAYSPAGLVWTEPLGFDNTFAMVVRADAPASTLSASVAPATRWIAGFGYEFAGRPDGYPALRKTYGLGFAEVRTMDLGLLYRALVDRQIDVAAGNATDGLIDALNLRVLADDRHAFPPYEAVPVVRQVALDHTPPLGPALASLAGRVSAAAMRRMNRAVDGDHEQPADVVRAFLTGRKDGT